MLGSKNRDYKTSSISAVARVSIHIERTNELVLEGIEKESASKKAFNEILKGDLNNRINKKIKEIKNNQNN